MIRRQLHSLCILAALSVGPACATPPTAPWFPKAPSLPKPSGQVIRVSRVEQLFEAARTIEPGGTILLADGHYRMPRYFAITTDNVTLRSESGDRNRVILDGSASRHGELVAVTGCEGVTIGDLTIQNVKWNGFKINSDQGAQRVRIHNCVIHNVWQRGVKGPAVPREKREELAPRDCCVQYCLFYNDRAKQFSDDETDTPKTFNGNYIAGIDVMNAVDWKITDNVFVGIQGRTREGRGSVFIWQGGRGCVIERNLFIDCDVGIALGNPSHSRASLHATGCIVCNNFVLNCPETGILACYTKDCRILNNTIHDPDSSLRRLIWVQNSNDGLHVKHNLLIGPQIQITSRSAIELSGNEVYKDLAEALKRTSGTAGQSVLSSAQVEDAIAWSWKLRQI